MGQVIRNFQLSYTGIRLPVYDHSYTALARCESALAIKKVCFTDDPGEREVMSISLAHSWGVSPPEHTKKRGNAHLSLS